MGTQGSLLDGRDSAVTALSCPLECSKGYPWDSMWDSQGNPHGIPRATSWESPLGIPVGIPMRVTIVISIKSCPNWIQMAYKNSRILFSFFSGGLRPPHPPDKSAFGLPRRVRNSWYHGTMVPWYRGSVVGMVPMVPMVHVVAWYRGTMVPMVGGYHGTGRHFT